MSVEVVSNEKSVAKDIIFEALEAALASATKKRFAEDIECRVQIDKDTGDYQAFRRWAVIDPSVEPELDPEAEGYEEALEAAEMIKAGELPYPDRQIWMADAQTQDSALGAGDFIEEPLDVRTLLGALESDLTRRVLHTNPDLHVRQG